LAGDTEFEAQMERKRWPHLKQRLSEVMRTKTRAQWCDLMEHTDICFAPVLSLDEASAHPHNVERGTFTEVDGVTQPAPAPRFSRTPGQIQGPPVHPGTHTADVLDSIGRGSDEEALRERGVIG